MNNSRRKQIQQVIAKLNRLQEDMESLETLMEEIEIILEEECEYRDNMPENLQGSERYEKAEAACDALESAKDGLGLAKDSIDDAVSSLEEAAE